VQDGGTVIREATGYEFSLMRSELFEADRALQAESDPAGWLYGVGTGAAAGDEAVRAYLARSNINNSSSLRKRIRQMG